MSMRKLLVDRSPFLVVWRRAAARRAAASSDAEADGHDDDRGADRCTEGGHVAYAAQRSSRTPIAHASRSAPMERASRSSRTTMLACSTCSSRLRTSPRKRNRSRSRRSATSACTRGRTRAAVSCVSRLRAHRLDEPSSTPKPLPQARSATLPCSATICRGNAASPRSRPI